MELETWTTCTMTWPPAAEELDMEDSIGIEAMLVADAAPYPAMEESIVAEAVEARRRAEVKMDLDSILKDFFRWVLEGEGDVLFCNRIILCV